MLNSREVLHLSLCELRRTQASWACSALAGHLSRVLLMHSAAAFHAWRSIALGFGSVAGLCDEALLRIHRIASGETVEQLAKTHWRAAAAEEERAQLEVRLTQLAMELDAERTVSSSAASEVAASHRAELRIADDAARRRDVRTAKLVQMQTRELCHMRHAWATCTIYAHLVGSRRLCEAAALHRWQLWIAHHHAEITTTSATVPSSLAPSAVRVDRLRAAEDLKCMLTEHRREARLLSAGWATAKLQLALSPCPSLAWAFRCWCACACATAKSSATLCITPDLAIDEARAAARDSLVEAQREVTTLTRALGSAALRHVLSCDRRADAFVLERAMHMWRSMPL